MPAYKIGVRPDGLTFLVNFTSPTTGAVKAVFTDSTLTTPITLPATVTTDTDFYFAGPGRVRYVATLPNGTGVDDLTVDVAAFEHAVFGPVPTRQQLAKEIVTGYAPILTPTETLTYNTDGTVATMTVGGVVTTYTYNTDGTVATEVRSGTTRTYSYNTDGTLAGVA